jgi:Dyp-type peroxidase family
MLFDADANRLSARTASIAEATTGCRLLRRLDARTPDDGHDHFGFLDGISQPKIQEAPKADESSDVAAGEFVLGYPDGRGELQPAPALDDKSEIGKNGTYVVLRQIEQDVGAFNRWLERHGKDQSEREALAAKVIGRWRDGRPLVDFAAPGAHPPPDAYFDFTEDRFGLKCPLGSHVRRANPRDDLRDSDDNDKDSADLSKKIAAHHRIIRRGRIYGPLWRPTPEQPQPDASRRGLYFMCLIASISDQFEFIQQAWVNNPSFRGLYGEVDPLVGASNTALRSFTVQAQPVRCRYSDLPGLTAVRGGAYFFMPAIRALKTLATPALPTP